MIICHFGQCVNDGGVNLGNIYTRLFEARNALKLTQKQVAQASNLGLRTYCRYESGEGKRDIPSSVLKVIAQNGININWLLSGEGEMFLPNTEGYTLPLHRLGEGAGWERLPSGLWQFGDLLFVALLGDTTACCGKGFEASDYYRNSPENAIAVKRAHLGVLDAEIPPYAIQTSGRSMVGFGVPENSVVVVNPAERPDAGHVVLASIGGKLAVKKFYPRPDQRFDLISSDGSRILVDQDELDSGWVHICGRVMSVQTTPEDGV